MSSPVRVRMIRIARRLGAFGRCETLRDRRHLVPPPDREPLAREDRAILRLESATVAGHTLKIAILDPSADRARPDVDGLRARIGERIERAPRLRRRLEMRPSGGRTAWVDDPTFDVREHVRAVPVAKQFSNEDLRCFCACMMEERLDRSRPLWTIDVLAPFEGGGVVVVWRLHHALADGATALRLAEEVLWDRPAPSLCQAAQGRSSLLLALREGLAARRPGRLPGTLRRELRRTRPPSLLDGVVGASRTVAFASTSLSALKRATKALVPGADRQRRRPGGRGRQSAALDGGARHSARELAGEGPREPPPQHRELPGRQSRFLLLRRPTARGARSGRAASPHQRGDQAAQAGRRPGRPRHAAARRPAYGTPGRTPPGAAGSRPASLHAQRVEHRRAS